VGSVEKQLEKGPDMDHKTRFTHFHAQNPQVFSRLKQLALHLHSRGVERYGIKGLFEVLRYEHAIQTAGDPFKLNNNYTAYYARLIIAAEPVLADFFELRACQGDQ
jgi:hypothetical protein